MKCKHLCGNDLTGRQLLYCSDKCRMQHKRQAESERDAPQPERTIPNRSNPNKVEQKPDINLDEPRSPSEPTNVFNRPTPADIADTIPWEDAKIELDVLDAQLPTNFGESDCKCKMCATNRLSKNPHIINHGSWKRCDQLATTELNRVPLPGDVDYKGVAV